MKKKYVGLLIFILIITTIIPVSGKIIPNQTSFNENNETPIDVWFLIGFLYGEITDFYEDGQQIKFYALGIKFNYILIGFGIKTGYEYWEDELIIISKTRGKFRYTRDGETIRGIWTTFTREF